MLLALIPAAAFTAFADALDRAMKAVEPELYGMYTAQSGNVLRDRYDRAAALKAAGGTDNDLAVSLRSALAALVPLESYRRVELDGFAGVTETDIAAMELNSGSVSVNDGFVTLSGEGTLRYCNAAKNGIAGPSPFGAASSGDGFAIKINSASKATLDLEAGVRGSENDRVFTISDIAVSAGEKYYLFPFSRFGSLPLDGSLNYISLSFTGTSEVAFGDLHAVSGSLDPAVLREYRETAASPETISAKKYYKLLQKDSSLALTMLKARGEGDGVFDFTEDDPDNDAQLWQLCPDPDEPDRVRIVNKHFGYALKGGYNQTLGFLPSSARSNLTNGEQLWKYDYSEDGGFAFYVPNWERVSYSEDKLRITGISAEPKYFDVVDVGGPEWSLAWSDEFDTLDRTLWLVSETSDPAAYSCDRDSEENVRTENGELVLQTIRGEYKDHLATNGDIRTQYTATFGCGRYEFRSKVAGAHGVTAAFWMMGEEDLWPFTAEIDVLEMVGSGASGDYVGEKRAIATFHYAGDSAEHVEFGGWTDYGFLYSKEPISDDYHIYALEWDKDQLRWYYDDLLYMSLNIDGDALERALRENPMHLRISAGVHGQNGELYEDMPDNSYTYVDYVRYYKDASAAMPQEGVAYDRVIDDSYLKMEMLYPANSGAFTSAADRFVFGTGASDARVVDLREMVVRASTKLGGEEDWIMSSAISADGSAVALGSRNKLTVADSGFEDMVSIEFPAESPTVAFSNDGSFCYAGGNSRDDSDFCRYFYVYNTSNMYMLRKEYTGSWVDSIAVAANDRYAYGCFDGSVYVRGADGTDLGGFKTGGRIVSLAFSPDCGKVYAASGDFKVYVYDIESGSASVLAVCGDEIYQIAVSPDGTRVAAACGDSCARVWDTATGRLAARPCLGRLLATDITYSLDGKLLAVSGSDGLIGVYRADDGYPLAALSEGVPRWFNNAAISSDNSVVMTLREILSFRSGAAAWQLPADLIPEDGGDASALDGPNYYDETLYTPESYAAYSAALKSAHAVRVNRYSAQSVIDSAARALGEAEASLVEIRVRGDVDGDGDVTVSDALAALRIAAKLREPNPSELYAGDADGDGGVTVADALAILRAAVKLTDTL